MDRGLNKFSYKRNEMDIRLNRSCEKQYKVDSGMNGPWQKKIRQLF